MARFDAIAAITSALAATLDAAAKSDAELDEELTAVALTPAKLAEGLQPQTRVLGLWLYAVSPNAQRRALHRPRTGEERRLPGTAVDLHYLLIARAEDPVTQQKVLGWGIRTLEDNASLPPSVLNVGAFEDCFHDDETIQLTLEPLTAAEENDIWQVAQTARVPAAPYLVRQVALDSTRTLPEERAVSERDLAVRG